MLPPDNNSLRALVALPAGSALYYGKDSMTSLTYTQDVKHKNSCAGAVKSWQDTQPKHGDPGTLASNRKQVCARKGAQRPEGRTRACVW